EVKLVYKDITFVSILPDSFPENLPDFYLKKGPDYIDHVNWNGKICFGEGDGIAIDLESPESVAIYCIGQVIQLLIDSCETNHKNLLDEFEGYCLPLCRRRVKSLCMFKPDEKIKILVSTTHGNIKCFFTSWKQAKSYKSYSFTNRVLKGKKDEVCLYIPLIKSTLPPLRDKPWTHGDFLNICKNLSSSNQRTLINLLEKNKNRCKSNSFDIVFSQPRPCGGERALFGLHLYTNVDNQNPFLSEDVVWKIDYFSLDRHYKEYLQNRAGCPELNQEKKVVLIGCGSVGSRIAEILVKSGVSNITLVDFDFFTTDNLYRHSLGASYLYCSKVLALKDSLEWNLPNLNIQVKIEELETLIKSKEIFDFDIAIVANGQPTIELKLNKLLKNSNSRLKIVNTWLEPFGLGGHAILSNKKTPGCLQCLFTNDFGERKLSSNTSFIQENQSTSISLTGCGGLHSIYSNTDAIQTAILASKLVLQAINENSSDYICWKGMPDLAQKYGIKTSGWYRKFDDSMFVNHPNFFKNKNCPLCKIST
ncbi:ThiF family adenylyltransferase, partial [bacterium]|nr:ThiF family adenylyltransferase [bacterium]